MIFATDISSEEMMKIYNFTKAWIYATSELKENKNKFTINNVLSKNNHGKLCWATRVNGGVDESILLFFAPPKKYIVNSKLNENWQKGIVILNGFAKTKLLYQENNRVKDIEISLYRFQSGFLQDARKYPKGYYMADLKLLISTNVTLKDEYMVNNYISFPISLEEKYNEVRSKTGLMYNFAMILKIKSVYKGTKYNDLCISKIEFITN
jgi:hypothetical protein